MDYTTCMTIIIICLFAMGCLCCVWITCCGIALMETKYAYWFNNNFSNNFDAECNVNNEILKEEECILQMPPVKMMSNDQMCIVDETDKTHSFIRNSDVALELSCRPQLVESKKRKT